MPLDIINIKHRDLFDKLKVFEIAGEKSDKGWDYAIPQGCFDELLKMGIEEPSRWFVADCTKGIFAQLRHIGEAVFTILHARSEANKEISLAIHGDEVVSRVFHEFADNAIFNEADCGLLDLNLAIGLVTEAYSRGRKSSREDALALVNEKKDPNLILESSINPGDEFTAPHSITLRKWSEDQWVTHSRNHQAGGYSEGHYFFSKYAALTDYAKRCDSAKVEAF